MPNRMVRVGRTTRGLYRLRLRAPGVLVSVESVDECQEKESRAHIIWSGTSATT